VPDLGFRLGAATPKARPVARAWAQAQRHPSGARAHPGRGRQAPRSLSVLHFRDRSGQAQPHACPARQHRQRDAARHRRLVHPPRRNACPSRPDVTPPAVRLLPRQSRGIPHSTEESGHQGPQGLVPSQPRSDQSGLRSLPVMSDDLRSARVDEPPRAIEVEAPPLNRSWNSPTASWPSAPQRRTCCEPASYSSPAASSASWRTASAPSRASERSSGPSSVRVQVPGRDERCERVVMERAASAGGCGEDCA
jgi:hypothetical protein